MTSSFAHLAASIVKRNATAYSSSAVELVAHARMLIASGLTNCDLSVTGAGLCFCVPSFRSSDQPSLPRKLDGCGSVATDEICQSQTIASRLTSLQNPSQL